MDYKDLFTSLDKSISDYTSDAFDNYDKEDVKGLLVDRLEKAKERMEDALEAIFTLCEPVPSPKSFEQYLSYFCGNTDDKEALKETEEKRLTFYKTVVALIRAYNNIAPEIIEAGYTAQQAESIKEKVNHFTELRNAVKIRSGDYIDLKKYEPEMRQMLDLYLTADPSRTLTNFGEATLLKLIVELGVDKATDRLPDAIKRSKSAMAETLEANMRKVIIQEMPINPVYYEKMSVLLTELIEQRKKAAISYEEFLKKIQELANKINPDTSKQYPGNINTSAKRALFDNLDKNEELAVALYDKIMSSRPDDWQGVPIKEKAVKLAIKEVLNSYGITDSAELQRIFELVTHQNEFR